MEWKQVQTEPSLTVKAFCILLYSEMNFLLSLVLNSVSPAPFAVDGSTSELVVTAPVDREEMESYHLDLVCIIRTEEKLEKFFSSLHVDIYDEDDNPPFVNGTDTEDIKIEFNRSEVGIRQCKQLSHLNSLLRIIYCKRNMKVLNNGSLFSFVGYCLWKSVCIRQGHNARLSHKPN